MIETLRLTPLMGGLIGLSLGVLGGGFLIVPALVLLVGMDMPEAVGSSLVMIAINSAAGLCRHLSAGGYAAEDQPANGVRRKSATGTIDAEQEVRSWSVSCGSMGLARIWICPTSRRSSG
ncbi:MAG TPA: TSUP family transporter [Herpetosiphonaceae bacterium]